MNEPNSESRLPIHEAAFTNNSVIVERILESLSTKGGTDDETDHANIVQNERVQEMVEAATTDYYHLTPILAATVVDARRTIECLVRYGAKVTSRDGDNRSMAAIAIFKQNVDLFLYFAQAPYANELDLWNTLLNMFTSRIPDDSLAAGRILEQLTSPRYIKIAWTHLFNLRPVEKTIQVLIQTVKNNCNEQLLISCSLILYNLMCIDPNIRNTFSQNEAGARALVQMRKTNEPLPLLFAHIVSHLCEEKRCIRQFVNQNVISEVQRLLDIDTSNIPIGQACLYFDILAKIAASEVEYQSLIQESVATERKILAQTVDLLERFDRPLTLAIHHFFQKLCAQNEQQQQICAHDQSLIGHLLSGLDSMHRDVQRSSVNTLQMIVTQNSESQMTILQQGGAQSLLTLLDKATLPGLRISIICTLWSLPGKDPSRRQAMAYDIGVSTLVQFLNLKTNDQWFTLLDIINELLKRVPTEDENMALDFGSLHCIPPIVRLLTADWDQNILLKCLDCIQQLCLQPTFRPCRKNQTIFEKANGLNQMLAVIRRANKDKLVQAKAITTIAYAIFDNKESKESLTSETIEQLFKRIATLLNSFDENVRIEAGAGLVTFVCDDINYYNLCAKYIFLDQEYFYRLLRSENISTRCNAAFQMTILIHLICDTNAPECMGRALMALFRVIADPQIDNEGKLLPTDIIGRLARIPSGLRAVLSTNERTDVYFSGFGKHRHSGVCEAIIASDGLEYLMALLESNSALLRGNAAVTIGCLVRHSSEGQRRLWKQCRIHPKNLDILRKYMFERSSFKTKMNELFATLHHY